jgi:hypothetical protein
MHGPNIAPEVDNLTVALEMAAAGLPVFPAEVTFDEKKQQWQKKPHIKDWQKEATTDARTLRYWWSDGVLQQTNPGAASVARQHD